MKMRWIWVSECVITLFSCFTFSLALTNKEHREGELREDYRIGAPVKPDSLFFCAERVPLENEDAWERLDRELMVNMYWQSNQLLAFKRAYRWFSFIEPILKEEGVPDDFKYLALIESSFLNMRSEAGAAGFWQFLKGTAKEYGLEVNNEVDERLNVEKATRAACAFLKRAYKCYGSWTLAAASYNTGLGNIDYHLRTQGNVSYYQMHLPDETLRYVFRILAEKVLFLNSENYGYCLSPQDLYAPHKLRYVEVDTNIENLFDFAVEQKVLYKDLKKYNPWLVARSLPNKSGKLYQIALPIETNDLRREATPIELSFPLGAQKESSSLKQDKVSD